VEVAAQSEQAQPEPAKALPLEAVEAVAAVAA
jgi:hypothetical protein